MDSASAPSLRAAASASRVVAMDAARSSVSRKIQRGSSTRSTMTSSPRCAEYSVTRNFSMACRPRPWGTKAQRNSLSITARHDLTRLRFLCRPLPLRSGVLPPRVLRRVSTTWATASAACRQNACTERWRERTGSSGTITDSATASQAKPIVPAITNDPIRSLVMCPAAATAVARAPITARLAASGLRERSANDKNICRTRNAETHTGVALSPTVTTIATADTTEAPPSVRTRSRRRGSVTNNAAKKQAPVANRVIRDGSATPKAVVAKSIVAHASTVAPATAAARRSAPRPGRELQGAKPMRAIMAIAESLIGDPSGERAGVTAV